MTAVTGFALVDGRRTGGPRLVAVRALHGTAPATGPVVPVTNRPRAELTRQVTRFDVRFRERTLPDPFSDRRPWEADVWWYRRLTEGGQAL